MIIKKTRKIALTDKKHKVRLSDEEMAILKEFLSTAPSAYESALRGSGVYRNTIDDTIQRGWCTLQVAISLRDFIKTIPNIITTHLTT